MMKTVIVSLLFCFMCVFASPSCSREDYNRCSENNSEDYKDFTEMEGVEETVERNCRLQNVIQCELDVLERCPSANFSWLNPQIQEKKRINDILCDKSNAMRKKYLDNDGCIKKVMKEIKNICNNGQKIDYEDEMEEYCNTMMRMVECAKQTIAEKCGEDAQEVYLAISNPDHHLRMIKCT